MTCPIAIPTAVPARTRPSATVAALARRCRRSLALLAALLLLPAAATRVRANDLSDSPCTAGDVEIVGSGIVINEPCTVPANGLFDASVQFTVRNNTSTGRYCISLHLVADGTVITAPIDLVLRDANGNSTAPGKSGGEKFHDTVMYGTIANYSSNAGVVCFGQAGVVRGKCAPNTCTTIAWATSPGGAGCASPDQNPPGGQCRHQQVCIVGYGARLACISGCNVTCGGNSTLQACVDAAAARGPFTLKVVGNDGSSQTQSVYGDASGATCVNFNVSPTKAPATTYTLTVTDKAGCTRTAIASVNVSVTTATITPVPNPGCNGVLTFNAAVAGFTGCSYAWKVDGQDVATFAAGGAADDARVARVSGTGNATFAFRALDGACHTIAVTASCSSGGQAACGATASTTVKQCVSPTLGCTN